jgi:hypothetical protein
MKTSLWLRSPVCAVQCCAAVCVTFRWFSLCACARLRRVALRTASQISNNCLRNNRQIIIHLQSDNIEMQAPQEALTLLDDRKPSVKIHATAIFSMLNSFSRRVDKQTRVIGTMLGVTKDGSTEVIFRCCGHIAV